MSLLGIFAPGSSRFYDLILFFFGGGSVESNMLFYILCQMLAVKMWETSYTWRVSWISLAGGVWNQIYVATFASFCGCTAFSVGSCGITWPLLILKS